MGNFQMGIKFSHYLCDLEGFTDRLTIQKAIRVYV